MIGTFGKLTLIIALIFACLQSMVPLWGLYRKNYYATAFARPCLWGQFFCVLTAYLLLTVAFIQNDFSLIYVAANSHETLPLYYRITALWGAHEGSILLWILLLSGWSMAFQFVHRKDNNFVPVLVVLGFLSSAFLIFLLFTSNPFITTLPVVAQDLNPLLQDPGFVIHPPMLYTGYVGFAIAFAITFVALTRKKLDVTWARTTRYWALASWCFLTIGITLGSWWAYRVLGWGGFWFWDPVENVSLLPWLAATALIHVLMLVEKKNVAQQWGALLAIVTFLLSLLGIFLVRSGVLVSAHTFANDPARGVFLLSLFALVAVVSISFYVRQFALAVAPERMKVLSRGMFLLLNSLLFVVAMTTVLIGTIYPLLIEISGLGAISVGAPYFNLAMFPIVMLILLVMGLGPLLKWNGSTGKQLWQQVWRKMVLSVTIALAMAFFVGPLSVIAMIGFSLAIWVVLSVAHLLLDSTRAGMSLAHSGFAVLIVGIILAGAYSQEREVRLHIGESSHLGPYTFKLAETKGVEGSNYRGIQARFVISKQGRMILELYPEKRIYVVRDMLMTKVAIHPGIFRDLYISLGEPLSNQEWSVRLYYKPFIRWIWVGGGLMMVGGVLSLLLRRKEDVRL